MIFSRDFLVQPAPITTVITSAVSSAPANTEERAMKCVTSQREDSTAHVRPLSADTSVNSCFGHVKTS